MVADRQIDAFRETPLLQHLGSELLVVIAEDGLLDSGKRLLADHPFIKDAAVIIAAADYRSNDTDVLKQICDEGIVVPVPDSRGQS